jgi:hypothetical protein
VKHIFWLLSAHFFEKIYPLYQPKGFAVGSIGESLVKYSPDNVGGIFCVGAKSKNGIICSSHSSGECKLNIEIGLLI